MLSEGYARGGSGAISRFSAANEGLTPLLGDDPACLLVHQGDFMLGTLPERARIGVDIDVFPFPPMVDGDPTATVGGGNLLSVLADRPEVREFVERAASPEWGQLWAAASSNQFVSPSIRFDLSSYGPEAEPDLAETRRTIGRLAQDAIASGAFRFDASDLMPGPIGSATPEGEPGAFWQGMVDVVDGKRTMEQVLTDIEAAWQELDSGWRNEQIGVRHPACSFRQAQSASCRGRSTVRKPMWLMPVSTICGRRAAGR
jgi:alpha-glucoside transport system substrate-binding protein